ncbi:MAG: tripartite tricarboxylate transporter substrate binding protein [Polaromonas sp.]|uniref:Bug family tripartite tricarboxylate transporter substrate binding protein n=1 Tax=Polaromonas sp. TaxID=1869339 RepID=UPI0025E20336|nr:tripartite tricarboxylate transporter substrate binding protein [Polaromonas sp.]MBI2726226.1 tripartite tricarboxylate transporter substrate binding protein [Polaromonas sp.]
MNPASRCDCGANLLQSRFLEALITTATRQLHGGYRRITSACHSVLLATLLLGAAGAAQAQAFPERPLRWIVGFPAGSGLDFVTRVVADSMSKSLGQSIAVDNRPGAAGAVAVGGVTSAPRDGYTLMSVDIGTYALNPHLYTKLAYEPKRDLKMAGMLVSIPMVMFVPASLNVNTVAEYINYVKSKPPGTVNYASSGLGTAAHLTMEMFKQKANLNMVHVPYKGSPPAFIDLMAGQVSALFVGPNDGIQHVRAGKLKMIGTATPKRLSAYSSLPTFLESGYDVGFQVWLGMAVAAGTPQPVVDRLNQSLNAALVDPTVMQKLNDGGFTISDRPSSQQADEFAKASFERWGQALPELKIKLD